MDFQLGKLRTLSRYRASIFSGISRSQGAEVSGRGWPNSDIGDITRGAATASQSPKLTLWEAMVNSLALVQLWREPGLRQIPAHSTAARTYILTTALGGVQSAAAFQRMARR